MFANMEQRQKIQLHKYIVNGILFVVLFILFLVFYLHGQTDQFLKGSSTFASRKAKVHNYEMPVLVLCLEPSYKTSVYGNRSTDLVHNFQYEFSSNKDQSLAKVLESASYRLNEDIMIEWKMLNKNVTYQLKLGNNSYGNFMFEVHQIYTAFYGSCFVLESTVNPKPKPSEMFSVIVQEIMQKTWIGCLT